VFVEAVHMEQRMGADADETVAFFLNTSAATAMLAEASEDTRRSAIDSVRDALAPYSRDGGVFLGGAAWLVTAHTAS
jgi:hypothetical protein